jgi:MFS transporter, DHA3 family, macrolide efflux protein
MFKVISSNFIGNIGSQIFSFGLGLLILLDTGSALMFSITILIGPVVSLLLTPFVGYVVDHLNRKYIIIFAQVLSILSLSTFLLFLYLFNSYDFISIIILLVFLDIFDQFLTITFNSSVRSLVVDKYIEKTSSFLQISNSVSQILAPVLGGILIAFQNLTFFVITILVTEFLSLIINMFVNFKFNPSVEVETNDSEEINDKKEGIWSSFASGLRYIKANRLLLTIIYTAVLSNFLITSIFIGIPFVTIDVFQMSEIQYGLVETGIAIGTFIAGIIMAVTKDSKKPLQNLNIGIVSLGFLIMLLSLPLFLTMNNDWVTVYYFILNIGLGGIATFVNVPIMVIMHKTITEKFKGRIFSIFFTSVQIFNPLGIFIFGILFEVMIPHTLFIISGTLMLIIVGVSYFFLQKERKGKVVKANLA